MKLQPPIKLESEFSSYIDFLRFTAALAVLLAHMELDGLYMAWMPLARFSHEAVVVFFVLSGLIIYSTTAVSHRTLREYIIARVSRIYSVVLPAIVFSVLASFLVPDGFMENSGEISNYRKFSWWDIINSLLFLNESWQNPSALTMNAPFWSLCYEVWYYVLFGIFFFFAGKLRWVLFTLFACIAGPAILTLFPIWIAGAWLAKNRQKYIPNSRILAWVIFLGSFSLIYLMDLYDIDIKIKEILHEQIPGFWRLESSQRMITDFIVGMAIMINITVSSRLGPFFRVILLKSKNLFSYLAGFSFTLYLFHRPVTQLVGYYFPNSSKSVLYSVICMLAIILFCLAISYLTERQLKNWRIMCEKIFHH